jgi:hypothetical protein
METKHIRQTGIDSSVARIRVKCLGGVDKSFTGFLIKNNEQHIVLSSSDVLVDINIPHDAEIWFGDQRIVDIIRIDIIAKFVLFHIQVNQIHQRVEPLLFGQEVQKNDEVRYVVDVWSGDEGVLKQHLGNGEDVHGSMMGSPIIDSHYHVYGVYLGTNDWLPLQTIPPSETIKVWSRQDSEERIHLRNTNRIWHEIPPGNHLHDGEIIEITYGVAPAVIMRASFTLRGPFDFKLEGTWQNDDTFVAQRIRAIRVAAWNEVTKVKMFGGNVLGNTVFEDLETIVRRQPDILNQKVLFWWRNADWITRAWLIWGSEVVFDVDEELVQQDPETLRTTLNVCAQGNTCPFPLFHRRDAFLASIESVVWKPLPCRTPVLPAAQNNTSSHTAAATAAATAVQCVYRSTSGKHALLVEAIDIVIDTMKKQNGIVVAHGNCDGVKSLVHALVLTCTSKSVFVCSRRRPFKPNGFTYISVADIAQCPAGCVLVILEYLDCHALAVEFTRRSISGLSCGGIVFVIGSICNVPSLLVRGAVPVSMALQGGTKPVILLGGPYPTPECHSFGAMIKPNRNGSLGEGSRRIMVFDSIITAGFVGEPGSFDERVDVVKKMSHTIPLDAHVLFVFSSSVHCELTQLEMEAQQCWDKKPRSREAGVWRNEERPNLFTVGDPLLLVKSFHDGKLLCDDVVCVEKYGIVRKDGKHYCPTVQQEDECSITLKRSTDETEKVTTTGEVRQCARSFRCCLVSDLCRASSMCCDVVVLVATHETTDEEARCAFEMCKNVLMIVGWNIVKANQVFNV